MRSFRNMKLAAAVACVLISGCATQQSSPPAGSGQAVVNDASRAATGIVLGKSLHFATPDGSDMVVPAGRYHVEPTVDAGLRLVPETGAPPLSLAASSSMNDVDVMTPAAVSISSGEEDHIVFVLPGGTTLDAIGSSTGVGTRGPKVLPKDAIYTALTAKGITKSSAFQSKIQQEMKTALFLAVQVNIQPGAQVSGYQACDVITGYGYVSSVKSQETLISPPGIGTKGPVTTNPRSGYLRALATNNPYRCAIGSVTVTPTQGTLKPGDHVQLLVAGFVFTSGYPYMGGYWVEDTYELAASGNGPLTFPKVVMAATFVGDDPRYVQQAIQSTVSDTPRGAMVGAEAIVRGESAGKVACAYTPFPNGYGAGTVSCAPGMPYAPTGR